MKSLFPGATSLSQSPRYPRNGGGTSLNLVLGSHDKRLQVEVNKWRPVQVFNLSITPPDIIEATHERMRDCYHRDGGLESFYDASNRDGVSQ